jgi:acetyltransferase
MMEETKAYSLLKGIRGENPADIESVKNTILRVSQLVWDFPEIVEMDINPLFVYGWGEGSIALDVKITLTKEEVE